MQSAAAAARSAVGRQRWETARVGR